MLDPRTILALRPARNRVDPWQAYASLQEWEPTGSGQIESFNTLFLTNRECPFRCLMCDLWKNTLPQRVPLGAIPQQIRTELDSLPSATNLKLYNSGNFFDPQAIPPEDYSEIAELIAPFRRVVVENHPRLTDRRCLDFQKRISAQLEIAMGLETIHPKILPTLNKQMTLDDFAQAVARLLAAKIDVRAFVLLKPPGLDEEPAIEWAIKSLKFAFEHGVPCCSLIPVRAGNGAIDRLIAEGLFQEPSLRMMEITMQQALELKSGRVFMDLWDASRFASCRHCAQQRISRLAEMNLLQQNAAPVHCPECSSP